MFAARAFKTALFGTAPRPEEPRVSEKPKQTVPSDFGSTTPPPKPTGILLTPGTGTSRPKRVSFGRDVKQSKSTEALSSKANFIPRRTRLNEALENARRVKISGVNKKVQPKKQLEISDDEWEEEMDDEEDNYSNPDMTLDLNEPHSQSGKFWKEEYEKYHHDAKAEMEKMLKYKQLAKSYAQHKDNEAMELAELLKDEQQKVVAMEKKIAQHASELIAKGHTKPDQASPETLEKLTKQTTLAAQYKRRVEELEDQLEDFLEDKEEEMEALGTRRKSPRAQMTLVETQRELRRAKSQVRENGALREQVASLQSRLRAAEQRALKAETRAYQETEDTPVVDDLKRQLQESRAESEAKDSQIAQLKKDLEAFKLESQAHQTDSNAVLERAHAKIAELKKEVKTLKTADREKAAVSRPKSWHAPRAEAKDDEEDDGGTNKNATAAPSNRVSAARSRLEARRLARRSAPEVSTNHQDEEEEEEPPLPSQTLRDKFKENAMGVTETTSDLGAPYASGALRERPNFEKPRWQPFVPRSPRNRAYLGDDIARRIENGGITPTPVKKKDVPISDLPVIKSMTRADKQQPSAYDAEPQADQLRDRFANLDGPVNSSMVGNTSKPTLSADRRAAALARIEERMAEKRRARGRDKENQRP